MQSSRNYSTWSWRRPDLKGCVICGRTDSPHRQKGICYRCSWIEKAKKNRERMLIDKEYAEKVRKQARENAIRRRSINPEVKIRENLQCKKWYIKNKEYRIIYCKKYYNEKWEYHRDRAVKRTLEIEPHEADLVRKKSNYSCAICGKKDGKLDIHHIDGNGLNSIVKNNNLDNLIYLCSSCHTKEGWKRRKNVQQ